MEPYICAIDFEGSLQTGILEYGIVGVSLENKIFFAQTKLCKNRCNISALETQCHGIDEQQVCNCDDFSSEIDLFLKHREKALFCAHNAAYENRLLTEYCPVVLNALEQQGQGWGPWLDTYILYKNFLNKNNCGLGELVQQQKLQEILSDLGRKFCPHHRNKFHCALYDAIACALLWIHFVKNLTHNSYTIRELLRECCTQTQEEMMRQGALF